MIATSSVVAPVTSAQMRWPTLENSAGGPLSNLCRDRAAISRKSLTASCDAGFDTLRGLSPYYDSILIQPVASGDEYRVFLLDDEVIYSARKYPPSVLGDGVSSIRELLAAHNEALRSRGLSPVAVDEDDASLDDVPARGARQEISGRMEF